MTNTTASGVRPTNTNRKRLIVVLVAVVVLAGLIAGGFGVHEYGRRTGWWGESDMLRTLKADPMANPNLLGLRLEYSDVSKAPGIAGKSGPTYYDHWFSVDKKNKDYILTQLSEYAAKNGWVEKTGTIGSTEGWFAKKQDSKGSTYTLFIGIVQSNDTDNQRLIGTIQVSIWY